MRTNQPLLHSAQIACVGWMVHTHSMAVGHGNSLICLARRSNGSTHHSSYIISSYSHTHSLTRSSSSSRSPTLCLGCTTQQSPPTLASSQSFKSQFVRALIGKPEHCAANASAETDERAEEETAKRTDLLQSLASKVSCEHTIRVMFLLTILGTRFSSSIQSQVRRGRGIF